MEGPVILKGFHIAKFSPVRVNVAIGGVPCEAYGAIFEEFGGEQRGFKGVAFGGGVRAVHFLCVHAQSEENGLWGACREDFPSENSIS